jgi:hypothetical protein
VCAPYLSGGLGTEQPQLPLLACPLGGAVAAAARGPAQALVVVAGQNSAPAWHPRAYLSGHRWVAWVPAAAAARSCSKWSDHFLMRFLAPITVPAPSILQERFSAGLSNAVPSTGPESVV